MMSNMPDSTCPVCSGLMIMLPAKNGPFRDVDPDDLMRHYWYHKLERLATAPQTTAREGESK